MALVEGRWLAGQRRFFLPVLRAVVRHGKTKTGGGAQRVLVVEHHRFHDAAGVRRILSERLRVHLRLRLHLDSLHPQFDDSSPCKSRAKEVRSMWNAQSVDRGLLPAVRDETARGQGFELN